MTNRIFQLVVLFSAMAFNAIAHNAKIATYTLRDTGAGWYIEMNFAQAAIDAQMIKLYDEQALSAMSEAVYKKSFLDYLANNFQLTVDGKKVPFTTGGILLGSHQTDVKYVLPEVPPQPQTMHVYLPMFEDIYNQTNLFRIYRGGGKFTKFFLSADNDFTANMEFTIEGIVEVQSQPYNRIAAISGVLVALSIIVGISFLISARLKNSQLRKA